MFCLCEIYLIKFKKKKKKRKKKIVVFCFDQKQNVVGSEKCEEISTSLSNKNEIN